MTAADFEDGASRSGWWDWSHTKHALEWLFWSGLITTSTRDDRVHPGHARKMAAALEAARTLGAELRG